MLCSKWKTYLTFFFKRCKSTKVNKERIESIIRLHKENKGLFGDIIATPRNKGASCLPVKGSVTEDNYADHQGTSINKIVHSSIDGGCTKLTESFQPIRTSKYSASFTFCNYEKPELDSNLIVPVDPRAVSSFSNNYPSVTKILSQTMSELSRYNLKRWKDNLIAKLGEDGFEEFNRKQLALGTMMHDLIHQYMAGTSLNKLDINEDLKGCFKSLESVLPVISNAKVTEAKVSHPSLKYNGVIDCVAYFRNKPVIIDWKKSDKSKATIQMTYEAPLQVAAYIGALNHDNNYPFSVNEGLLVVANTSGSRANVFHMQKEVCEKYWAQWIVRLNKYYSELQSANMNDINDEGQ